MKLFTEDKANTKLAKSAGSGEYLTIGLFLAPHTLNTLGVNLCPFASKECAEACLNTAGRAGIFPMIGEARKRKADFFLSDRAGFLAQLVREIASYRKKAQRRGKTLVVRLNGTSDIDYDRFPVYYTPNLVPLKYANIFEVFPDVVFYDYTKSPYRMQRFLSGQLPANYHLTFSFSGENRAECFNTLKAGGSVSVVFDSASFPETWLGFPVVNGDLTDLRFLDARGVVVGLKAKGKARKVEAGGFIQIAKAKPAKWESVEACQFHKVPLTNGAECAVCKHSI